MIAHGMKHKLKAYEQELFHDFYHTYRKQHLSTGIMGNFGFQNFRKVFPKISTMEVSRSKLSLFFIIFIKITENELCN